MKKKLLAMMMTLAVAGSALAGCGTAGQAPESTAENAPAETAPAEEPAETAEEVSSPETADGSGTTVTFWNAFTGADGDMLVDMVERFNQENTDGITVEMDISADFDSQLSTALAAGTGPTMILASSASRFTYGDYMQDVSDIFTSTDLDKADFIESYLDYCSDGDTLYFVPFQIVGYYMYWNKDLFEEAGIDPEAAPAT